MRIPVTLAPLPLALALLAASGGCRDGEVGPPPDRAGEEAAAPGEGSAAGGEAASQTPAAPPPEAEVPIQLEAAEAGAVLHLLDQGIAAMDQEGLLTVGAHCGATPGCVSPQCGKVLRVCRTASALEVCGEFLQIECPAFADEVGEARGEELRTATERWIRARYGRMIEAARELLAPGDQARLDAARARHGL